MSNTPPIMRWLKQIRRSESGSAMVETALTLPLFIALLLGAVELGDLAYKSSELTNAARDAAQYASTNSGAYTDCKQKVPDGAYLTCDSTSGVYKIAQNDAPLASKSCANFTVQVLTACTCSGSGTCSFGSTTAGYTCTSPTGSGKPVINVSVATSAQCSPSASIPNLFPIGGTFTLSGFSQQEVTQ
jgi:Flp pilus assembly protein TadG